MKKEQCLRISNHPILGEVKEKKQVKFFFEGQEISAYENEPIAVALLNAGIKVFRYTRKNHEPRGIYCALGHCTDCMMIVDDQPNIRACITPVEDGMAVKRSNKK